MGDMGLRNIESTLPPGFRFYPSDEELVCHYLYKKLRDEGVSHEGTMVEVDLHTCEPWELPEVAKLGANEWYFFSFRDCKYSTGSRTNRATRTGYWKATGKDRTVYAPSSRAIVGMRKTLVFYRGRAPNGIKSSWVMHEFRLEDPCTPPTKEDWVLCRVLRKKKGGEEDGYNMSHCPSPTLDSSPPHQVVDSLFQEGTYDDDFPPLCTDSSSFDVASSFLQCNYLVDFPPQEVVLQESTVPFVAAMGTPRDHKDTDMNFGLNLDMGMDELAAVGSSLDLVTANFGAQIW